MKKRRDRRNHEIWCALLLAALCVLSPLAVPAGEARAEETLVETAIPRSDWEDDGVLRVCLRSLGAIDGLHMTLDGAYTVEHDPGFRFARGTNVSVWDGGDTIWMDVGGLSLDVGSALTLTRQAATDGGENGIRIAEAGRDNLYPGDLSISLEEGGGLRAVLAVNMEDYLLGVVAYEMSDSWPVEALKAQAVAARTYAMRAKANAGNRDYDLVDTTADQVYRGTDASLANVAEAVRATSGVVGMYEGGFANCYYTASNGGETALPSDIWEGDGDFGYLKRRADPYDLENQNSMVASVSFTHGATDLPALRELLQAKLEAVSDVEDIEFEAIRAIEPVHPVAAGSSVCTALRFTLSATAPVLRLGPGEGDVGAPGAVTGRKGADLALYALDYLRRLLLDSPYVPVLVRQTLDEEFSVELDVYDDLKRGLGLSLNSSDCEVFSVVEDMFGYTLEARRFGHGVGMSQRGAQTMAGTYNMSWTDILSFYYPGMDLEWIDWDTPSLKPLEELSMSFGIARPSPSPSPTPAPLPTLDADEFYARVALDDASSSMNLRQSPSTQAPVVAQLSHGQRVIVSGKPDEEGWVRVRTAEYEGYAKLEYLRRE